MKGKGKLPRELALPNLAIKTTWTYHEIMASPAWFIDDAMLLVEEKTKADNRAIKKAERDAKK